MGEAKLLDASFEELAPTESTKNEIANQLWGCGKVQCSLIDPSLSSYWSYYREECTRSLHEDGQHIAIRTHKDIITCVGMLRSGTKKKSIKEDLRSKLTASHENVGEMLKNSVDLAARLLVMMTIGDYSYGFSGRRCLNWENSQSLKVCIRQYFESSMNIYPAKGYIKLEKIFTAHNLSRIAGLEVVWTDNLLDHLRLADDDKRVHIFHHASFLEIQKNSENSLLPKGLADETLRTLALLIPSSDPDTRKWFKGLPEKNNLDEQVFQYRRLKTDDRQIDKFKFWSERLVMVKQVFDEAQPQSLSQWWHDRRNGVQWYTFWVAILVLTLTVVFGLIQSIEGGLQAYASLKGLNPPHPGAAS